MAPQVATCDQSSKHVHTTSIFHSGRLGARARRSAYDPPHRLDGNNRLRMWDACEGKHSDVTAVIVLATPKGDAIDVECIRATCSAPLRVMHRLFHEVLSAKRCIVWTYDAADWISKMASRESRGERDDSLLVALADGAVRHSEQKRKLSADDASAAARTSFLG